MGPRGGTMPGNIPGMGGRKGGGRRTGGKGGRPTGGGGSGTPGGGAIAVGTITGGGVGVAMVLDAVVARESLSAVGEEGGLWDVSVDDWLVLSGPATCEMAWEVSTPCWMMRAPSGFTHTDSLVRML